MGNRCNLFFLIWLAAGCACGAPASRLVARSAESAATALPIEVSLAVETPLRDQVGTRLVLPEETLLSGDQIAMHISVDRPAYVYLLQATADGSTAVVFPAHGGWRISPESSPLRVPEQGQWFALDQQKGREQVILVASSQPLDQRALLRAPKSQGNEGKKDPPKCPEKTKDECNRGRGGKLWARTDERGIAVIQLPFHNR